MDEPIVLTKDLKKYFSTRQGVIKAVDGVDLSVKRGEVFGFLGPNGAGKTTTLRVLTTLLPPDFGQAIVAGFDVSKQPDQVRRHIGYVGQAGGSDRPATGRENLILQGRLCDMPEADVKARAEELIDVLDLKEFADRIVYTYSGGQRRRLDVALGIMNRPDVLFLDEPTTGLDPQNRANLWAQIQKLRQFGTTIFLTTHYLEEADQLADRLAIMDYGRIAAEGTPEELKKQVAFDVVTIGVEQPQQHAQQLVASFSRESYVRDAKEEEDYLRLFVKDGAQVMPRIIRLLDKQKIKIDTITLSTPTLDDVFLQKTGRSLRDIEAQEGGGR